MTSAFPPGFIWGAATAAAQIEGAAHEEGKEDSIWDAFARLPGAIHNSENLDKAVDHYHRMPEDVAIMKTLGLSAYRFSTSWSRIKPGDRTINHAGLDFYSRLVDELLNAAITPWVTLYHWDLPQAVEECGGWANRDTAYRFRDYADSVYSALGDRVAHWTTFNEPFCSALLGYAAGIHAPGRQEKDAAVAAVHHQHLAHGIGAKMLRERGANQVGITLNLTTALASNPDDPVDIDAARRLDGIQNRLFLDPLLLGSYPEDLQEDLCRYGLERVIEADDMTVIMQPLDFLGVNYYHDDLVSGHPANGESLDPHVQERGRPVASPFIGSEHLTFASRGLPQTAMGWEVNPDGLRHLLLRLSEAYPALPPIFITENGAAYLDIVSEDGRIYDVLREEYIFSHLSAVGEAMKQGVDVRGYFVWSLLDNFEWAWGYEKRFGIVHVDYETLIRTPKDSAIAYAKLIAETKNQ